MGHIHDRMRREREREDCQRLARIADHRHGGDHHEADRQRDIEADARVVFADDREADIRAGGEREQERAHLREPQFLDETLR